MNKQMIQHERSRCLLSLPYTAPSVSLVSLSSSVSVACYMLRSLPRIQITKAYGCRGGGLIVDWLAFACHTCEEISQVDDGMCVYLQPASTTDCWLAAAWTLPARIQSNESSRSLLTSNLLLVRCTYVAHVYSTYIHLL